MNILKALFGGEEETQEQKRQSDEARRFDMFKYDGVKAARMGRHDYAAKCFAEALALRDDLEVRDYLAQALVRTDRLGEAMEQLSVLAKAEPENAAIQRQMARVAFMMGDYEAMERAAQRALALDGGNADAHYLAAQAQRGRGDMVGAVARLTQSIALNDDNAEARLLRGQTLLAMGDTLAAMDDAQWLAEHCADSDDALMLLARCHRAMGHADEAMAAYGRAIDANPFCADAYRERGALRYEQGDTHGAQQDAAKAMELQPSDMASVSGDYSANGIEHKTRQSMSLMNPLGL